MYWIHPGHQGFNFIIIPNVPHFIYPNDKRAAFIQFIYSVKNELTDSYKKSVLHSVLSEKVLHSIGEMIGL